MRRLLPVILLASACGGTETSEMTFPAGELKEFILRVDHGAVVVRNPQGDEKRDTCVVRVTESGTPKALGAKERFNASVTKERLRLRQRRREEKLRLELLVIVPKGVNIDIVVRDGGVRLEGEYGLATVTCTAGDVVADPLKAVGGTLKTREGNVMVVLESEQLESNLACETIEGAVSLHIPIGLHGPVHLFSGSAEIDYGKEPRMLLKLDPDRKNARGIAGRLMTQDEIEVANRTGRWPPGVWAKTGKGKVVFRQTGEAP